MGVATMNETTCGPYWQLTDDVM